MPVKNEESLARLLGASFTEYANRVQNGLTAPYVGLLSSDTVEVVFVVSDNGGLTVKAKDEPVAVEPVVIDEVMSTALSVEELESPVLEAEKPIVEPKPKRKRKKQ